MTSLADLFPERDDTRDGVSQAAKAVRTRNRLTTLVGGQRPAPAVAVAADDTDALVQLVGDRAPAAHAGAGAPPEPTRIRRGRSGRDWLSIAVAVLAVVALAGAATVTGVSLGSASPTSGALKDLTQNEAVLVDDIEGVNRSIAALAAEQADGVARAGALAGPLAAVAGMTDEPMRQAAEAARVAYLTAASSVTLPAVPAAYRRGPVDQKSLESVGAAVDAVNERSVQVHRLADDVAAAKDSLARDDARLAAALQKFAATVQASAAALLVENADALERFQTDVTGAATAVATTDLASANGPTVLGAYATAVTALRADHARAAQAIAEENERLRQQREAQQEAQQGTGGNTVEPDPAPTPVEPNPVDPAPAPDPGAGGGETAPPAQPDAGAGGAAG